MRLKTKELFIEQANKKHNNAFDYSQFNYVNGTTKGLIKCNKCQTEKWQTPNGNLSGRGCRTCSTKRLTKTRETFIIEATAKNGNKCDYSQFIYVNSKTKGIVICTKCQTVMSQTPETILKTESTGCVKCAGLDQKTTTTYIEAANIKHNHKYDYSKFIYERAKSVGIIICKKCKHEFPQRADQHLKGQGCPMCYSYRSEKLAREIMERVLNGCQFPKARPAFLEKLEYDGYNPRLKLAFEYQGQQHEKFTPFYHKSQEQFIKQQERDVKKKKISIEQEIDIVYIPWKYTIYKPKEMEEFIIEELTKLGY